VYLVGTVVDHGDISVYVDMRTIGSTGGIYSDRSIILSERATRLLMDTLAAIHEQLLEFVIENAEEVNLGQLGPLLDSYAEAITEVRVSGSVEVESRQTLQRQHEDSSGLGIDINQSGIGATISARRSDSEGFEQESVERQTGVTEHRVHFGRVGQSLSRIVEALGGRRIWLILDEWSVIPFDLQPYLADLIRRSILPITGITIKLGAIEQRTHVKIAGSGGEYIGFETGADVSADLNLDDYMVFENDPGRSRQFFQDLLFKHYLPIAQEHELEYVPGSSRELMQNAFTRISTFEEFVRASEGVPRDAINILSIAAQRAGSNAISADNIRSAARTWFQRDKEAAVSANSNARDLLHWIVDRVIAHRRARAFLIRTSDRSELIDTLFDSRVLHLLKPSVSAHDQPGVRFDAFKIDYGCYVDLLTTARAPIGLFQLSDSDEEVAYVDVPPDDYRAIRRAILDLNDFERVQSGRIVNA